ncbi:hypothetical protein OHA72_21960 [Dactylosporangium sp. NBC_01737]|uniref:hypothetical protein n=1 Tax=Dactylosporangium sp. NBC_01737 TaxID=2975959 RepID=UPI002E13E6C2|nr:hypothetical protein OHA72_21960 [Dactylosporangium sp. NBC_01737]
MTLLARCLGCGQRTAVRHLRCKPIDVFWEPCPECAGLRVLATGGECEWCDGVGFTPTLATQTLAEIANGEPVPSAARGTAVAA